MISAIPKKIKNGIHYLIGFFGALMYFFPSTRMHVIGITGTSGKSTVCFILRHILSSAGLKCGVLSTIEFFDGKKSVLNDKKMTMLGRTLIHRWLWKMKRAGCKYAIVETTSEGVVQYRHKFINYDTAVFTNLYPEHIESHGGFKNYKKAKLKFFEHVAGGERKPGIPKTCIVAGESEHAADFLNFNFDNKIIVGREGAFREETKAGEKMILKNLNYESRGFSFLINEEQFRVPMFGRHNVINAALAIAAAYSLGLSFDRISKALEILPQVPGRIEMISEGQNFLAIVDYAFEIRAMQALYVLITELKSAGIAHGRVIHVLGGTGGGRDRDRRYIIGEYAGKNADFVIVTNEDSYDEDPMQIINEVAQGAEDAGKILDKNLWKILDRETAINMAVKMAGAGDLVLLTGKGSEQAIVAAGGRKIPWDDREVLKKAINSIKFK